MTKLHLLLAVGLVSFVEAPMSLMAAEGRYEYISSVYVYKDHFYIRVWSPGSGSSFNQSQAAGCGNAGYGKSKDALTDENTKAMLSIAMTAFVMRRRVYVLTDGCTAQQPGTGATLPAVVGLAVCRAEDANPANCP